MNSAAAGLFSMNKGFITADMAAGVLILSTAVFLTFTLVSVSGSVDDSIREAVTQSELSYTEICGGIPSCTITCEESAE